MTEEEFEKEIEDIAQLMRNFYEVKDKGSRRRLKQVILYYTKRLLKI